MGDFPIFEAEGLRLMMHPTFLCIMMYHCKVGGGGGVVTFMTRVLFTMSCIFR